MNIPSQIFTDEALRRLFPPERSHDFFDALFGDASEGAYDIVLSFDRFDPDRQTLHFFLNLHERPGRCLACNLTYGLPEVFSRHPVINIKKLTQDIEQLLGQAMRCVEWKLEHTIQKSRSLHAIPLEMTMQERG